MEPGATYRFADLSGRNGAFAIHSKRTLSWLTALVLRELEAEVAALEAFRPTELRLMSLMREKGAMEARLAQARLALQRLHAGYTLKPKPSNASASPFRSQ